MRVRGYRVFYIDHESGIKDLINLIKSTTAVKIALVIKNGHLILNSTINLRLISKYIKRYRKEMVFVSPDPLVVEKVIKLGFELYSDLNTLERNIPVNFENFSGAGNSGEDSYTENIIQKNKMFNKENKAVKRNIAVGSENNKDRETREFVKDGDGGNNKRVSEMIVNRRKKRKAFLSFFFSIFLILLILGMAYFYFVYPTATIEIEPVIKSIRHEINISASTEINQIDWENNIIPLHETEIEISGQEEVAASGVKLVGDTRARGLIKFINERKDSVSIPAGTILMTDDNIKFKTVKDLIVPELQVDYLMDLPVGMKAGQAEVEIVALEKGSRGNVALGRIKKLASPEDKVYVINPAPSIGGKDKKISLIDEKDIDRVKSLLNEELKSKLLTKIYQELGGNFRIIEDNITYSKPVYNFEQQIGEEADTLIASGTLIARGYLLKNNEIDRLVTKLFKDKLSDSVQLMSSGINIDSIKLEEKDKNMYNILIAINAPVIPSIDSDSLVKQISGLDIIEARSLLEQMEDIDSYRIRSQRSSLPNMVFAIKVVVKEPEDMKVFNISE